ncbi:TetR family transcriptional regulator [Alkalihalophilus pseudofirmus]|uniref:forespore capture DNA-binding protein RefZ n=1 Tax=Alkalihalobacterium alkalinitrilicum TaxID=427920 RepID=UPI00094D19F0|nr:forespore capture DNA-binding protein RefZ [Alkalihalobacterium alkalinitrilicum]OLO40230.1 TetR family transcriptional regulator [Alkalihalophilus pseudofirmus]
MTSEKECTKQKIMDAAISLFNVQGFTGTSVRMIANRANVNVALISYYFGSKKGLLEELMSTFFEGFISALEEGAQYLNKRSSRDCLLIALENALIYQQENHHLARFVHREITLDTMLVREVMSTYLMKEKHMYYQIIKNGMDRQEFKRQPIDFIIIQLRGMLIMPFLHPQYIREVHHLIPHERYFLKHYISYLTMWMDSYLSQKPNHFIKKALG